MDLLQSQAHSCHVFLRSSILLLSLGTLGSLAPWVPGLPGSLGSMGPLAPLVPWHPWLIKVSETSRVRFVEVRLDLHKEDREMSQKYIL